MGDVVVLARAEAALDGRVAVPAWAARRLGLDRGVWEVQVRREGRVVLRRVPEGPWGKRGPEPPAAA